MMKTGLRMTAMPAQRRHSAFTLVELLVVIAIIVLVLAIAVPGMASMTLQARFSGAQQSINGALSRAFYISQAEQNTIAIRFVRSDWEARQDDPQKPVGGFSMIFYRYVTSPIYPEAYKDGAKNDPEHDLKAVKYHERFERLGGADSVALGDGIGVAPLEALSGEKTTVIDHDRQPARVRNFSNQGAEMILKGSTTAADFTRDGFYFDTAAKFMNAEDFLIVCDPRLGVRVGPPTPYHIRIFDPRTSTRREVESNYNSQNPPLVRRFAFSGVTLYRRDPFLTLGAGASGEERQQWLRENSQPFLAHRFGGGLIPGARPSVK